MKAVIWTDVLQAVVILVGLLAAIIQGNVAIHDLYFLSNSIIVCSFDLGFISLGGIRRTFSIASAGGRIIFDRYELS